MDGAWDQAPFERTVAQDPFERAKATPEEVATLQEGVREFTTKLKTLPYDPASWCSRGLYLLLLGYPELAIGDLYKTIMLFRALEKQNEEFSDRILLHQCMHLWVEGSPGLCEPYFAVTDSSAEAWSAIMNTHVKTNLECAYQGLAQGLIEVGCFPDALRICREARSLGVDASNFESEEQCAHDAWAAKLRIPDPSLMALPKLEKAEMMKVGALLLRPYPWIAKRYFKRTRATMTKRAAEMEKASNGKCSIFPSTIGSADSYGIKALMDIEPGEVVMQEKTVIVAIGDYSDRCTVCCVVVAAPKGLRLKCCKMRVCSLLCAKLACLHFEKATCVSGTVSRWSVPASSTAPTYAARERLMEKLLAILVQGQQAPLLNPIVNQLMAPYSDTQTVGFNFGIDIVTRFEFLQTLGIDIFANQEYDTWVLHTIAARIQNNAHHGASVEPHQLLALHPLYSFFNHSCARNAFWEPREDQVNSLFVTATTKIKRGEEIFISYHGVEDLSFQARKIVLSTWFPDGCQCERCQRE